MGRIFSRFVLAAVVVVIAALGFHLASLSRVGQTQLDINLLASDAYFSIGDQSIVAPMVALEAFTRRRTVFTLDPKGDTERARAALQDFRTKSATRNTAPALKHMWIIVDTYGWNTSLSLCQQLERRWAKSVCDNPWSAIRQALPHNRFALIDLQSLDSSDFRNLRNCLHSRSEAKKLILVPERPVVICQADVGGSGRTRFFTAVVSIEGNLGALWTVWDNDNQSESATTMVDREGAAIIALVRHGLGPQENFSTLQSEMCQLRRPGSEAHPNLGSSC